MGASRGWWPKNGRGTGESGDGIGSAVKEIDEAKDDKDDKKKIITAMTDEKRLGQQEGLR